MPKSITVFTRPTCAPCKALKTYFTNKGIQFNEINVDEDREAEKKVVSLSGRSMVPMTLITAQDDSQQVISGLNISGIVSAIGR